MLGGTDSIQTKTVKESLTLWVRVCARALPCRHVWKKEKYWKELIKDIMSLIKWPTAGWWKHWFLVAKTNVSESPSKVELCKSSSWRKWSALRAAIVSKATMNDGRGIILDRAAKTSLEELRTTTPIPTFPKSSKTTPSKFVFKVPVSGGFQMTFFGDFLMIGLPRSYLNSVRYCWARSESFSSSTTDSLTLILFRRFHMN